MTLGIIGVLSAITLPTLIQNYQKKSYVTQLHKVYNELQQAAQRYIIDNNAGNLREAGLTESGALTDFFKTYFKVINDCGTHQRPCFASNYKKLSGYVIGDVSVMPTNVTIISGVSIAADIADANAGGNSRIASFIVDINGKKGPNTAGRDLFVLGLYNNGIIDEFGLAASPLPQGGTEQGRENLFKNLCMSSNNVYSGCFGKILNDNWEMTY